MSSNAELNIQHPEYQSADFSRYLLSKKNCCIFWRICIYYVISKERLIIPWVRLWYAMKMCKLCLLLYCWVDEDISNPMKVQKPKMSNMFALFYKLLQWNSIGRSTFINLFPTLNWITRKCSFQVFHISTFTTTLNFKKAHINIMSINKTTPPSCIK